MKLAIFVATVISSACAEPAVEAGSATAIVPLEPWPPVTPRHAFGRGHPPQRALPLALPAPHAMPHGVARVVPVGGDGPAIAVVEGVPDPDGFVPIELVEIDAGVVRWRSERDCRGPVAFAHLTGVVCGDARGVATIATETGDVRWSRKEPLVFADRAGVVVATGEHEVTPIDPAGTAEPAVLLPTSVRATDVRARCGRDLWAASEGALHRLDDGRLVWSARIGDVVSIAPCDDVVVVAVAPPPPPPPPPVDGAAAAPEPPRVEPSPRDRRRGRTRRRGRRTPPPSVQDVAPGPSGVAAPAPPPIALVDPAPAIVLVALDRASGERLGGPVRARGTWPARDGSNDLELATAAGIERRPRDLSPGVVLADTPVLGALLARRGDRLVVAGPPAAAAIGGAADGIAPTLYVLDSAGVRARLAAPASSAAVGDAYVLAAGARGDGDVVRIAVPPGRPPPGEPQPTPSPQPPVHRVVLAEPTAPPAPRIAPTDDAMILRVVVDPLSPTVVWALAVGPSGAGLVARIDLLAAHVDRFADACPPGPPADLAIGFATVACLGASGSVRAVATDGTHAWEWTAPAVAGGPPAISAAGAGYVVTRGAQTTILHALVGSVRAAYRTPGGGMPATAVALEVGTTGATAAVELGAIVTRAHDAPLAPLWSTTPRAPVVGLAATSTDLLAVLAGGDAYLLDPATGTARALAAAAPRWWIAGDLVLAELSVDDGVAVRAFDQRGERFRTGLSTEGPFAIAARGADPDAPVAIVHGASPALVSLDARTGQVLGHAALPAGATAAGVFTTVFDHRRVTGAVIPGLGVITLE